MSQFRRLNADRVLETIERLSKRIRQRFPNAGLGDVCTELLEVARDIAHRSAEIRRPLWRVRILILLVIIVIIDIVWLFGPSSIDNRMSGTVEMSQLIQTLEALLGACFFLGAGIAFLVSFENRVKRQRAISAIFEMRAMAHIVDMHQLTKDPERVLRAGGDTKDSPWRPRMTRFELSRYLDYCGEMLSLMGKVAALYVQDFPDSMATQAVDEVEQLTTSLSRKIWQKIMVLDQVTGHTLPSIPTGAGDYPPEDPPLAQDGGPAAPDHDPVI